MLFVSLSGSLCVCVLFLDFDLISRECNVLVETRLAETSRLPVYFTLTISDQICDRKALDLRSIDGLFCKNDQTRTKIEAALFTMTNKLFVTANNASFSRFEQEGNEVCSVQFSLVDTQH